MVVSPGQVKSDSQRLEGTAVFLTVFFRSAITHGEQPGFMQKHQVFLKQVNPKIGEIISIQSF
ncbi:MAG: hypothetical protein AAF152_20340 [Cyanobacteria bacterium P01_A01_bin.114]